MSSNCASMSSQLTLRCSVSTIGYIARFMSSREAPDYTLMPYIQQSLTLLVAPALFAGSIYMILKRIIGAIQAEHHSPIRMRWLTKLFVAGDLLSFFAQGMPLDDGTKLH